MSTYSYTLHSAIARMYAPPFLRRCGGCWARSGGRATSTCESGRTTSSSPSSPQVASPPAWAPFASDSPICYQYEEVG